VVPEFSREEVKKHNTRKDLWIIINDKVYDVTNYDDHDGGFDVFMDYAGKDATVGFEGKDENDHNHSKKALREIKDFYIGNL
jgi:cytochrome-b5 reductase